MLWQLNLDHLGPVFPQVDLVKPDLEPLLRDLDIPEDTKLQITKAVQNTHNENIHRVQTWSSMLDGQYRAVYSVSADLINGVTENLRAYGKLMGALDLCQQTLIRRSNPFLQPSAAQLYGGNISSKVKDNGAVQGPLMKSSAGQNKKARNKSTEK